MVELNEKEMMEVEAGGIAVTVATVTAVLALGKLAFECGEQLGRFAYVATH